MRAFYQQSVERFARTRDDGPIPDMTVGPVHAAAVTKPPASEPFISGSSYDGWKSLCGRRVKVILPRVWDEERDNACAECAERMRVIEFTDVEPDGMPNWTGLTRRLRKGA